MRFTNSYKEKVRRIVLDKNLTYHIDTMGCAMNENVSNKYGRVSSANKVFKLKDNYENMNIQEPKKNSIKRKEDELNYNINELLMFNFL